MPRRKRDPNAEGAQLIDALGGPAQVARIIETKTGRRLLPQAVSNWKQRGIPWRWRGILAVAAKNKKVAAPDDFFGIRQSA